MSEPSPSKAPQSQAPSMHPALSGTNTSPIDWSAPTILVCPLPTSVLTVDYLLPELSHEIKTPLSGIMGLAQIFQRQVGGNSTREYQYADLIYQKSQQLLIAINDLLDLSQLSTRQFVLHLQPFELSAVLKTAFQNAQRLTGLELNYTIRSDEHDGLAEQWIVADPTRLEQLFTHLINALWLQSPIEPRFEISFCSSGNWIAIILSITPLALSENELIHLDWPYQPSSSQVSALPSRSDAILKSLLAKQLTQLHGGDIAWNSDAISTTSVTVLLPYDLTRTTHRVRLPIPSPLILIVSQRTSELYETTQSLIAQGTLVMIARSISESAEKFQTFAPTILVIDSKFAQTCGWNAICNWLDEQLRRNPCTLIWLDEVPPDPHRNRLPQSDLWPWPVSAPTVLEALQQFSDPEPVPPSTKATDPTSASFTVLQISSFSEVASSQNLSLQLINQLSQDHGCSVLAVDDLDQAELLARIWKPKIMICPSPIPPWVGTFSQTSCLRHLPLVILDVTEQTQIPSEFDSLNYKTYVISDTLNTQSIKTIANDLYLCMTDLMSKNTA